MRCIDSERPSRPIATKSSANSGFCVSISVNSSQTISSDGSGSSGAPASRARSYSRTLAKLPAVFSSSWRRFISPARASCMRSTSVRSSCRLVMTAAVCGRSCRPRKVAPPLKSTRIRLSALGVCVIARPSTSVRSSSDLPDPVAPMTRPCGPMPSSAASLMSSSTGSPCSPTPIGMRSRSRTVRGRQSCSTRRFSGSPTPSMSTSSAEPSNGCSSDVSAAPTRQGAMRRAVASASLTESPSARPSSSTPLRPTAPSFPPSTTRRSPRRAASRPMEPDRSTSVTPTRPSSSSTRSSRLTAPPSMTRTTCAWSGCGVASRVNRARGDSSGDSHSSSSASEPATSRRVPTASLSRGSWLCGSHFTQSHDARLGPEVTTPTIS